MKNEARMTRVPTMRIVALIGPMLCHQEYRLLLDVRVEPGNIDNVSWSCSVSIRDVDVTFS